MYADYNYENIEDTDCLPAVAEYLVQHMRGYYNITRSFYSVPKANGHVEEKTREVTVVRHHEDTPLPPARCRNSICSDAHEISPVYRNYAAPHLDAGRHFAILI